MMNFIVSGQPKLGHESWPPPVDDKVLSDRLYGQRGAKEKTRMEIKFEKIGDRLITYYHFSKLKDVTSCLTDEEKKMNPPADHGRKGSFFVMSIRMDGYYSADFSMIFTLLDEMYENYVNGKVLKRSKEGYLVYQIMKLEDAEEIWKNIASELETKGWNSFLKQAKPISGDISIKGTKTADYFSVEDGEKDIESTLIQKGGVYILSSDEMKARNERIKQQEKRTNDEISNGERVTQHEFEAFVKATEDVQELTSTIDNSISQKIKNLVLLLTRRNNADKEWLEKLTSLKEEQENIIKKINAAGGRFLIPSHKKDFVKGIWVPIALIVIGLINLWLCLSIVNMKVKVNSLVEQIDSLTVQSSSSILGNDNVQELKDNDAGVLQDEAVGNNVDGEDAEITLLDLRRKNGNTTINVTDNIMRRGYTYIISAKTGATGQQKKDAKGTGQYSCDVESDNGINMRQDSNRCIVTIVDVRVNRITLRYKYKYGDKVKSFSRTINISQ